jgi:hypothetical protein
MRLLAVLIVLTLPVVSIATPQPEVPDNAGPTLRMFNLFVAYYYVSHHRWPTTVQQLRDDILSKRQLSVDERAAFEMLLSFFTKVELAPRGKDLLLIMRFHSGGSVFRYEKLFHPGQSVEEIVDTRTR